MNNSHFQKGHMYCGGGAYKCRGCGKRTRETGDGESDSGLCRKCFRTYSRENIHSDMKHEARSPEGCPECAEAGFTDEWIDGPATGYGR